MTTHITARDQWGSVAAPLTASQIFWAIVLPAVALRFALSFIFDLNLMETYGAVMGRYPSLSYLDHPPLAWWLVSAVTSVFGTDTAPVVRLPFLLLFIWSSWLLFSLTRRLFGNTAALYATAIFQLCPLFGLWTSVLALTDGPAVFFTLAAVSALTQIVFAQEATAAAAWRPWITAGFLFGCALASKYTAILLVPGLILFFAVSRPHRFWLRRPQPYVALIAVLVPLLPVLLWNAQHDWASFLFQGGRATPGLSLQLPFMLRWMGMQIIYLQPLIAAALIFVLVRGLRSRNPRLLFFSLLAVTPLLFFPFVMLTAAFPLRGFHWGIIGWVMLLPSLGSSLAILNVTRPGMLKAGLATSLVAFVFAVGALVTHARTGWIGQVAASLGSAAFVDNDPILTELFDWSDLPTAVKRRGYDPSSTFLTGIRWESCSKIAYIMRDQYDTLCLAEKNIHFSFINDPARLKGRNAIVADLNADLRRVKQSVGHLFDTIEALPDVTLTYFNRPVMPLKLYVGKNFKGRFNEASRSQFPSGG
jgi:4-amino-4-deoxy-L-arabinose transferase-like glycosyltransferase